MRGKGQQSRAHVNKFGAHKQNWAAFVRDIVPSIVATLLVLYALVALLSAELSSDKKSTPVVSNEQRVSDLGLRFAFKR